MGSLKSRTKDQEALSREVIANMIQFYSEDSTIAFRDGSCMGNPGPCGAGACISLLGVEEPVCLKGYCIVSSLFTDISLINRYL